MMIKNQWLWFVHMAFPQRRKYLKELGLPFRDGTCPDVGIIAGK